MNSVDTIRAWKDEAFRASLTDSERTSMPENPAGPIGMSPAQLEGSAGGHKKAAPLLCPKTRRCTSLIPGSCPRTFEPRQCPGSTAICTLACTVKAF
jgi:mersacidin/lichenicidin family type 2 lantibiotic